MVLYFLVILRFDTNHSELMPLLNQIAQSDSVNLRKMTRFIIIKSLMKANFWITPHIQQ